MSDRLDSAIAALNILPVADDSQRLVVAKCRALMRGYDARWSEATKGFEVESVEETILADLVNPTTQANSRTFKLGGKRDVIATRGGRRVLVDHKTTSGDIEDPNGAYWRQLQIEGQVTHYLLIDWLNGNKIDDVLWDVIRKPSISPKALTKADAKVITSLGKYHDHPVSPATIQDVIREQRENVELYEIRLTDDCINERPEWYFQRRGIPRLDSEVLEYANELWMHSQDLLASRRNEYYPRNPGACMNWGTACKFLGVCSGSDDIDSDRWTKKKTKHNELPEPAQRGLDVLTNSRIRCFQTCRRKHYYEYELGIERVDEAESEPLYFGSTMHSALNAWWLCFVKGNDDGNNIAAGNELANDNASHAADKREQQTLFVQRDEYR